MNSLQPIDAKSSRAGLLARWRALPLYGRILGAVALGLLAGVAFGAQAAPLAIPAKLVLRVLGALAPPSILLAIVQALMRAHLGGQAALRLVTLLLTNTLVAIGVGLLVANIVRPGAWSKAAPAPASAPEPVATAVDPLTQIFESIPKSILGPFSDNGTVMGVIFIAVAFGVALRSLKHYEVRTVEDLVHVALTSLITILHWIIDLVPLAVFGVVASIVGVKGFHDFLALGGFVLAVLLALILQAAYYATRVRLGSWVRPLDMLRGTRDALIMAFSTGSSTATMPVTYACLRDNVGLREESASMGALVGANFNNDGTALYEAMSALFVAQLLDMQLSLGQQFIVALTSVVASVGAAGIPEAGLVTMTMVFKAVALPTDYIAMLLTVDWLLDRCRTAINVMGDVTVSCLLDGKTPQRRD
jgi:Na+/H+-dicarboxylate symporter